MPTPPSENAMAVAKEVIETVRKGKKVNKGDIILNHGYAESISLAPTKVTETKSYQSVMNPFVEELITERNRAIKAMKLKDLDQVAYDKLSKVVDELTKNIQLLSGKETEKVIINKSLNDDEFDELMKIYESRKVNNSNGDNEKVS